MTNDHVPVVGRLLAVLILSLSLAASPAFGQDTASERETSDSSTAEERSSTQESEETAADDSKERTTTSRASDRTVRRISTPRRVDSEKSANVSPLVRAANSSGAISSKKSFTDADLKTTKGKLIVVEGTNVREPKVIPIEERSPEAVKAAEEAGVRKAEPRNYQKEMMVKRLNDEIRELRSELSRLQNEYLVTEEDDYRESVEERFRSKQKELESAQEQLRELQGSGGN